MKGLRLITCLGPSCVALVDFCCFGVAFVKEEAVTEGYVGSFQDLQVSGALGLSFKIVDAEWICGNQSIVTGMPPGGVTRICGMIEDGETNHALFEGSPVRYPCSALAPKYPPLLDGLCALSI